MIAIEKTVHAVSTHFDVTLEQINSQSRLEPLPMCRKIIIHLLEGHSVRKICEVINRDYSTVSAY